MLHQGAPVVEASSGSARWQLHRSENANIENFADARIANLDENTSAWLKVSASLDGSFTVTNGRTGHSTAYPR